MRKAACFTGNQSANQDPLTSKMAPWPEQGIGPKAPDKTSTKSIEISPAEETSVTVNVEEDLEDNASGGKTDEKLVDEKNPDVSNLNDGQLKALLDEALTYKCPKDREGKSNLFISLLSEAESDKPECVGGCAGDGRRGNQGCGVDPSSSSTTTTTARHYTGRRRGRRDATALEQNRGGSLQNLVHALSNEFDSSFGGHARGRKSKRGGHGVSVSARQREGGSLPSNVDACLLFEDFASCKARAREATCESEMSSEAGEPDNNADEGVEMEVLKKRDVYTTRATFEVGLGEPGKKPRIREEDVDLAVKFPLLQSEKANGVEPLQLPSSYNSVNCFLGQTERNGSTYQSLSTTGSTLGNALRVEGTKTLITNVFPMQHVSVLAIPPNSSWIANAFASDTVSRLPLNRNDSSGDGKGKSLDENGNAVTHSHRDFNNGNERKSKTRRTKTNNDRNVVMSQNIEGHRGDKDIDSLLEFIESDKERKVKAKHQRSGGVVSKPRGKPPQQQAKPDKLKKTNSLEEISKTKLEDLTSERTGVLRKPRKQSTMDDADLSRRSWGNEEYRYDGDEDGDTSDGPPTPTPAPAPVEETEFHVVTKKQRRKKRPPPQQPPPGPHQRSRGGFPPHDRDVLYRYHRPIPPDLRRKSASSMPPSDKSDSSDLDSVHSLPVSSTTPKLALDQTPQASYADIAKISSAGPANINVPATKWPAIAQSITSSKVNIGVPPISGKVTTNPVPSVKSEDGDEAESVAVRLEPNSKPLDLRPKKNAVINTPVDIKVIPPYQTDDKFFVKQVVDNSSNKVTLNNIQIEISDRTIKVSPAISSNDGVVKKKFVDLAPKPETVEETGKLIGDDKSDVDSASAAPVVAGLPTSEPQVLPTSDGAGVPISKVAKSDLSDNKSIAKTGKVNTGSKKPTVSLSRTARPAVIILDEKESVFVSQNISASDITFGFEVNELLLLSDGDESVDSSSFNSLNVSERQSVERTVTVEAAASPPPLQQHKPPPHEGDSDACPSPSDAANTRSVAQSDLPKELENTPPNQTTKVDEFFARFKSPITQLTESHTKIVNIIGLAWADVMQELEAGGDVQYYDGQ